VGAARGIFIAAVTVMERFARWAFRSVRGGAIDYWTEEIEELKNGGVDLHHLALEKDELGIVNANDSPGSRLQVG